MGRTVLPVLCVGQLVGGEVDNTLYVLGVVACQNRKAVVVVVAMRFLLCNPLRHPENKHIAHRHLEIVVIRVQENVR